MKRRQRKPVLDLNSEQQSESPRGRWQNKYQQIAVDHPEQNGNPNQNPLASLLGQYNSDSETESEVKQDSNKLNDKVNDFLKEIQMIAPDSAQQKTTESKILQRGATNSVQNETSNCPWQECFDETTGYPYYWHIETNEVTWEMPAELMIERDKLGQTNQQNQLKTQQTHTTTHAQVQWANYLPNTYPEMQTNIPEGMIPKEVVARNRNRQVGVLKNSKEFDTESAIRTVKKTGAEDYDSDEEKIEMITSFGNDEEESESETSDTDSKNKKKVSTAIDSAIVCSEKTISSSRGKKSLIERNSSSINKDDNIEKIGIVSIGPALPPGIIPMIHGPENEIIVSVNRGNKLILEKEMINDERIVDKMISKIEIGDESVIKNDDDEDMRKRGNENGKDEDEEEDEEEEEEEEDIISKIEREMPVDHAIGGGDSLRERISLNESEKKNNKEIKISLVAGYSDDSDIEEETLPKKVTNVPVKPLFPIIDDYASKDLSNLRISKEIKNDNECKFDNVENENRKSISGDGIENDKELLKKDSKDNSMDSNGGIENLDAFSKPEIESTKQNSFLDSITEIPAKGFQRKKRIAFDVVPNKIVKASQQEPTTTSLNFNASITSGDDDDYERHGFGFNKDSLTNYGNIIKEEDYPGSVETSLDKTTIHNERRKEKEIFTGIFFVKEETRPIPKSEIEPVIITAKEIEAKDNKELKEFTDIVMEKIKFLSEGSQNLSAIQIMVIQLQTLISAWEAGDLKENYLYEWLKGTGHELGRLEEAAAPPGWDCHWDRSHKRYYYRNSGTGEAQWTYPEADVVGGTEEMDLCTTPPPPEYDEEHLMIEDGRNNIGGLVEEEENVKTIDIKSELVLTTMPSLNFAGEGNKIVQITRDEYKSLEAPPPPQISSPSPPPPPRIYAEDLKKGKKRRGSINERLVYSEPKKEKTGGEDTTNAISSSSSSEMKETVDPPLPPSPPKNATQPPLPPNPPHPTIIPNPPSSEPLPPGVDPKDMPAYPLPAVTALEPSVVYAGTTRQPNQIYTAALAERGIAVPLIDHRSAIIQGQLMHYPTYQHLHNQAMIAAAGSLTGQEAVQFMLTDYAQVYTNAQVIAKPPVKSQNESLGSALDSFYSDIATIEKTSLAAEQDQSSLQQDFDVSSREAATPPPQIALPNPAIAVSAAAAASSAVQITEVEQQNVSLEPVGKEKKRKRTKIGIGKKQKEMSSMVAKWQKAQQDFEDSE